MAEEVTPQTKYSSRLYWTLDMDNCMLGVFLAHLAQGLRTHQGWKKEVTHSAIKKSLKDNLGLDISMANVDNRIKTMSKEVVAFKSLQRVSNSGFGWDPNTQRLTADDKVWEDALEVNSQLANLRKKALPQFMEWVEVLGEHTATGNMQKTSLTADEDTYASDSRYMQTQDTFDSLMGGLEPVDLEAEGETQYTPFSSTATLPKKATKLPQRKRKSTVAGIKDEMGRIGGVFEGFVDVMKEKNELKKQKTYHDEAIWDKITDSIYATDLEDYTKVEALELFSGDGVENLKRFFLRIPENNRKDWILKKLGKDEARDK